MTDPSLRYIEGDVARMSGSMGTDPMLDKLIRIANLAPTASLGFPIGFTLDGFLWCGNIGRGLDFAGVIDGLTERLVSSLRASATNDAEAGWAEAVHTLFSGENSYAGSVHSRFRAQREVSEAVGRSLDWQPDGGYDLDHRDARLDLITNAPFSAFTVTDAHRVAGAELIPYGTIRVLPRAIGSWWIYNGDIPQISEKADGTSRISLRQEEQAPTPQAPPSDAGDA